MNKLWRRLMKAGDNPKVRLTTAAVLGTVAWTILIVALGRSLHAIPVPEHVQPPPLEMRVVEFPERAPTPSVATTPSTTPIAETPKAPASKQAPAKTTRTPSPALRAPTPAPKQALTRNLEPAHVAQPQTRPPAQTAMPAAPSSPPDRGATSAESAPTGSATSNSPARAIVQPLPTVPDELREQAYQTIALARLVIHTDGTVAVELIRPTQYPRLNQILLETLRSWRFFPAMQDGRPIETQQDIRVRFNVS